MKRFILALTLLAFVSPAFAEVEGLRDKVDELELEQDVEDMEAFGELALQEENKRESEKLLKETRDLERQINQMKRQSDQAKKRSVRLQSLYAERAKLASKVEAQAKLAEKQKAKSDAAVAKIEAKVKSKEQAAVRSLERRKAADLAVKKAAQEERSLKRRLVVAEKAIRNNEIKRQALQAQAKRLALNNKKIQRKVVQAEARAARTVVR